MKMSEEGYIEHKKFLLELPNGKYLCHSGSKQAIIYDKERDEDQLRFDLEMTNGHLVALGRPQWHEIYNGMKYSNSTDNFDYTAELYEEFIAMNTKYRQYGGTS
jgi:hypothetical protein